MVDPALKLMIDAVRRYQGDVVQSTGDGSARCGWSSCATGAPNSAKMQRKRLVHCDKARIALNGLSAPKVMMEIRDNLSDEIWTDLKRSRP